MQQLAVIETEWNAKADLRVAARRVRDNLADTDSWLRDFTRRDTDHIPFDIIASLWFDVTANHFQPLDTAAVDTDKARLLKAVASLERFRVQAKDQFTALETSRQQSEQNAQQAVDQSKQFATQLGRQHRQIQHDAAIIDQLRRSQAELQRTVDEQAEQIEELQDQSRQLAELEQSHRRLEQENEELRNQLSGHQTKIAAHQERIDSQRATISRLTTDRNQLWKKLADAQGRQPRPSQRVGPEPPPDRSMPPNAYRDAGDGPSHRRRRQGGSPSGSQNRTSRTPSRGTSRERTSSGSSHTYVNDEHSRANSMSTRHSRDHAQGYSSSRDSSARSTSRRSRPMPRYEQEQCVSGAYHAELPKKKRSSFFELFCR